MIRGPPLLPLVSGGQAHSKAAAFVRLRDLPMSRARNAKYFARVKKVAFFGMVSEYETASFQGARALSA
jgi:hypothetical protein